MCGKHAHFKKVEHTISFALTQTIWLQIRYDWRFPEKVQYDPVSQRYLKLQLFKVGVVIHKKEEILKV